MAFRLKDKEASCEKYLSFVHVVSFWKLPWGRRQNPESFTFLDLRFSLL